MAKPFQETVNIQPQTISTGQSQQLMTLSQKLDDFSSFASSVAAKRTIETASAQKEEEEEKLGFETLMSQEEAAEIIEELEQEMREAAENLEFEKAAAIRDQIAELKEALSVQIG